MLALRLFLSATPPQLVAGLAAAPPLALRPRGRRWRRVAERAAAAKLHEMQYGGYGGQQGGYGQQQGYGGSPQQGYGGQQQGYGGQQQGYGGQAAWRIHPTVGVNGHNRFQAFGPAYANAFQKYSNVPYVLGFENEFVLGRWNMMQPSPYVSRQQCIVNLLADGNAVLTCTGKPPTGIRTRGGQWNPLYNGQQHYLSDGDQVSLDLQYNPEGAVFTFENAMQQGGYGQQQGGYGQQQGGYGQGGYGQQQGGYGQQQGGYY